MNDITNPITSTNIMRINVRHSNRILSLPRKDFSKS